MAVQLTVAGVVFDGVFFFVLFLFLDEIWDLIESVSEGFPTYFFNKYVSVIYMYMYAKVILMCNTLFTY